LNTGDIGRMSELKGRIIFEISLTYLIMSENRYLQGITVFYTPDCFRLSQHIKSLKT